MRRAREQAEQYAVALPVDPWLAALRWWSMSAG
jgi:hypothetical protein